MYEFQVGEEIQKAIGIAYDTLDKCGFLVDGAE